MGKAMRLVVILGVFILSAACGNIDSLFGGGKDDKNNGDGDHGGGASHTLTVVKDGADKTAE